MAQVIYLVLGVFIAAVAVHSSPTSDVMENARVKCLKEFDLTDQAAKQLNSSSNAADIHKLQCLRTCVMKKLEYMLDGKINLNKIFIDDNVQDSEKPRFYECANKAQEPTDECEIASSFVTCMQATRSQKRSND